MSYISKMNDKDKKKYDEYIKSMIILDAEIKKITQKQNIIILKMREIEEKYKQKK